MLRRSLAEHGRGVIPVLTRRRRPPPPGPGDPFLPTTSTQKFGRISQLDYNCIPHVRHDHAPRARRLPRPRPPGRHVRARDAARRGGRHPHRLRHAQPRPAFDQDRSRARVQERARAHCARRRVAHDALPPPRGDARGDPQGVEGGCERGQVLPARRDHQLVVRHRRLRRLLPRLQGDGGGGHGAQPARRSAVRRREEHLGAQRRKALPRALAQARGRLPEPPHRARARHDRRGGRVRRLPRPKRRVQHHGAPPLAHDRHGRPAAAPLLQAACEGAARPPRPPGRREVGEPQVLPRLGLGAAPVGGEGAQDLRGGRAPLVRRGVLHLPVPYPPSRDSFGELWRARQAPGLCERPRAQLLQGPC